MTEGNIGFSVPMEYDALIGRFIRKIKSNDIIHLSAVQAQYSAGTMNFTALSSTTEAYITGFGASSTLANGNNFYITIGNSTVLPISLAAAGHFEVTVGLDRPLAKASASSTISLCVGAAGTVSAWLSAVQTPVFANVETD